MPRRKDRLSREERVAALWDEARRSCGFRAAFNENDPRRIYGNVFELLAEAFVRQRYNPKTNLILTPGQVKSMTERLINRGVYGIGKARPDGLLYGKDGKNRLRLKGVLEYKLNTNPVSNFQYENMEWQNEQFGLLLDYFAQYPDGLRELTNKAIGVEYEKVEVADDASIIYVLPQGYSAMGLAQNMTDKKRMKELVFPQKKKEILSQVRRELHQLSQIDHDQYWVN